jgi:ankyrin repeat protein
MNYLQYPWREFTSDYTTFLIFSHLFAMQHEQHKVLEIMIMQQTNTTQASNNHLVQSYSNARLFLNGGINKWIPNAFMDSQQPYLHMACLVENETLMRFFVAETSTDALVKYRIHPGSRRYPSKKEYTPLWFAVRSGALSIVRIFLATGAGVNLQSKERRATVLHQVMEFEIPCIDCIKAILDAGADVDLRDKGGNTVLHQASRNGHEVVVRILLDKKGVNINSQNNWGWCALSWASRYGHEAIIRLLYEREDIDLKGVEHINALSTAESDDKADLRHVFARKDPDANSRDNTSENSNEFTFQNLRTQEPVVRLLLDTEGIDVNFKDRSGTTALIWASRHGFAAVVGLLLERKDIDIAADNAGLTALSVASQWGHTSIVNLLEHHKKPKT